ncbi:glutathione S-transferase [Pararobbsia silviterrae]|uniref:Glutathione S-transferase n=1 Tax=Pararobbsia silviterrae TaxID=1792498 RepID=A0A494Y1B8_9BURK|nr:glutathione S-transferase [Pararobbsia silviterrae]RKP56562.1 glutathione S-transferase [Pararobbsia silviterrae]
MKIFYHPASPFVRKVHVTALELGLDDRLEKLTSAAHPIRRDANIVKFNPTGKVPAFFTDSDEPLYDSRVICEYLDHVDGRSIIFPTPGEARWRALREQAIGDGLLDAALLARYELTVRPPEMVWLPWREGQLDKVRSSLDEIEARVDAFGDRFDIGTLTIACALGYLDFRFADFDWRTAHPKAAAWFKHVSERPSLAQSFPRDLNAR